MAPLFLPSLNVFKRDIGRHIYMTAVTASTTGNNSTPFGPYHTISGPMSSIILWEQEPGLASFLPGKQWRCPSMVDALWLYPYPPFRGRTCPARQLSKTPFLPIKVMDSGSPPFLSQLSMIDETNMVNRLNLRGFSTVCLKDKILTTFVVVCLVSGVLPRPLIAFSDGPGLSGGPITKEVIVGLTNEVRTANGLQELNESRLLNSAAEERARDMLQKAYFGHVSPTGQRASDVALRTGYEYRIIAENIAQGLFPTNQRLIDQWMQSPGHRRNILSPGIRDIGVAIAKGTLNGEMRLLVVQMFGLRLSYADRVAREKAKHFIAHAGFRKLDP